MTVEAAGNSLHSDAAKDKSLIKETYSCCITAACRMLGIYLSFGLDSSMESKLPFVSSLNLVNIWICIDVSEFIILVLTKDTSGITESVAAAIVDFDHLCNVCHEEIWLLLLLFNRKRNSIKIHVSQTSVLLNWD